VDGVGGDAGANRIESRAGNDILKGLGGADGLLGGIYRIGGSGCRHLRGHGGRRTRDQGHRGTVPLAQLGW
jgi:hypothetical protein